GPEGWPRVPGYEILGELGRGGMGVVFKARHRALKRTVALKMILAGECAAPAYRARFRAEAEVLARLAHPNIVHIYEAGENDGRPFIVLEYVAGGTLRQYCGKPHDPYQAARLVQTLAEASPFAHRRGVVHRDLKPANILLSRIEDRGSRIEDRRSRPSPRSSILDPRFSVPKITDFGLAKVDPCVASG